MILSKIKYPSVFFLIVIIVAYFTKPPKDKFENFLNKWIEKEAKKKREIERKNEDDVFGYSDWLDDVTTKFVKLIRKKFTDVSYKDYGLFIVASTKGRGKEYKFIGLFRYWIALRSLQTMLDQLQST
eukprot:TRINITY_DN15376_c0_g1_i1.p1 TRINITY_DN15376_c0_g1~~TRINITY_DN15376_c0_g1_i1.p1  ORF type:complete len:127 (+),score=29.78 TRINITY_DN15376_c0_g1_i1:128-508(+)